jgi:hypothetical protein
MKGKVAPPPSDPEGAAVYVIKGDPGRVKIGFAKNPYRRLSALRSSSPAPLSLEFAAYCTEVSAAARIEAAAHHALCDRRHHGDWFSVSSEDAATAILNAAKDLGHQLTGALPAKVPPPPMPGVHRFTGRPPKKRPDPRLNPVYFPN